MLTRNSSKPLYEQLKDMIELKINSGECKPDEQLPSERELGEIYNVSRITVRQALALAEQEGLVSKVHGVGTFVNRPKIEQELKTIADFQSTVTQHGLIASTEMIETSVVMSDVKLSKILNLRGLEKVLNLKLLGYGNDSPIVYYNTYFPFELGQEMKNVALEYMEKEQPFSTLDLYKNIETFKPTHVEQTFEASAATNDLAEKLQVDLNYPLLEITSILYQDQIPIEYKEAYYRGDKYRFFTTRNIHIS